jgi:uncharacterized protein YidB (DUF937 family)
MLNNLFDLVKQFSGEGIINNPVIPNEHNDAAVQVASNSIVDTLKNAVGNGNMADITNLFSSNNAAASPLANIMQSDMVKNLINQFGINEGAAANIAQTVLPNAINSFVSKTNDPNDSSFNLQDIVQQIAGNNNGFDIGNLVQQFTGGNASTSGLMDGLKGLFGK